MWYGSSCIPLLNFEKIILAPQLFLLDYDIFILNFIKDLKSLRMLEIIIYT